MTEVSSLKDLSKYIRTRPNNIILTSFVTRGTCFSTKHKNMTLILKVVKQQIINTTIHGETDVGKELIKEIEERAFDKTCQTFEKIRQNDQHGNLSNLKLVLLTEEYYDLALKFAREYFVPYEPTNKALGMQWTEEIENFWMNSFKQSLSLMFIDEKNQEPVAFRTTRVARYDDKIDLNEIQSKPLKELLRYLIHSDKKADFFGHFGVKEAFHFLGLAVSEKYKQRGLAKCIFDMAVDMVLNFEIDPVYVKVEGTSNFSKRIFENAGFETLYELPFDKWEVDGRFPIQNTGIHKSMKVYGKKFVSNS